MVIGDYMICNIIEGSEGALVSAPRTAPVCNGISEKKHSKESKNSIEIDIAYDFLERYLDRIYKRGRKNTTISTYRHIIDQLIRFLSERQLHCTPSTIGEKEIHAIVKNYPGISDWTRKYYINVLSKWMVTMSGNLTVREMDFLWPTSERPNRRWAEYSDALDLFDNESDQCNKVILALAMDEGMRACEIASVRLTDIRDGWIRICGKGHGSGKIRSLPISERVMEAVVDYMGSRGRIADLYGDSGYLLITKRGRPLTPHAVTVRVIRMGERMGRKMTAHSLRRRFITDTLNSGVKIEVCSKMVGHENPMITSTYYNCDVERISVAMETRTEYVNERESRRAEESNTM